MSTSKDRTPPTTVGSRLKLARLRYAVYLGRDYRVVDAAKAVGLSDVTLGRWEADKRAPSIEELAVMAELYRTTPEWLAWGREPGELPNVGGRDAAADVAELDRQRGGEAVPRTQPKKRRG